MEVCGIESLRATSGKSFRLCQAGEIAANFSQGLIVNLDLVPEFTQIGHNPLRGRIRYSVARRARGALHRAYAPVRCVHVDQLAKPDGAMLMELQRFVTNHGL